MFIFYQIYAQYDNYESTQLCSGCSTCFFLLALYIYNTIALMNIANKLGYEDKSWWAWIPFLNLLLLLEISGAPMWYVALMFIPVINIVVFIMILISIAQARGKPQWWGVLLLVPFANLVVMGFLAWAE